jgi:hypothetical protein
MHGLINQLSFIYKFKYLRDVCQIEIELPVTAEQKLLNRNTFREIAGLVYVLAAKHSGVIS